MQKWEAGHEKEAAYAVSSYIRLKLRENGIVRSQILPALEIADGQLDRDEDPTVLKKFMEIEPDSEATFVPFRGLPEARIVKGRFSPVYFSKIESQAHTVNIAELKNYSNDLRKILNDQDVKNIQREEDAAFMAQIDAIAAANPGVQDFTFFGGLTKLNWAAAQQAFPLDKPIKFALMNARTAREFLKWDYDRDMGLGVYGADTYAKGIQTPVHGIQIIQTIKDDLVPDEFVYFFAPEDFIGKFFVLQPPTTFIEQKADWLSFYTYEYVGIGIGNIRSFIRCRFRP